MPLHLPRAVLLLMPSVPAVLHVELIEQTAEALELRFWRDNPNQLKTRSLALSEITELIGKAETDYYSPLPAKLQEVGQRLFRWLDGGERWLATEIKATANLGEVLVLAIATPHRLGHLPWEVLHDGTRFLLHSLNPPVLPVRWRPASNPAPAVANRPLQVLLMAASPEDVKPVLDYEREESVILEATSRWPLDLTVEESGCLEELSALMKDYGPGRFDVLHLTGHAGHDAQRQPIFMLENSEGGRADATAVELARSLPHRPSLVFLSGCRTGQNAAHGEIRSLAEQMVEAGFGAVLGWGRPVLDQEATLAAGNLYQHLAAGESLAAALIHTHTALQTSQAKDWHLLRLFCAGQAPAALVTPIRTPKRKRIVERPVETEFLAPVTRQVKVATHASFVGRRRLLQRSVRQLRKMESNTVGLLLHGQGGRGKSSVAARLCARLRSTFQRVVLIGRLDETSFIRAWAAELPNESYRQLLRNPDNELRFRIEETLAKLAEAGETPPLFVLDDFEQNQLGAEKGDLRLSETAATVLLALCEALEHVRFGQVIITDRYVLPAPLDRFVEKEDVPPLDQNERNKQLLRLEQRATRKQKDAALLEQAQEVADGNPRLFEWLHQALEKPGLDHSRILSEMQREEEKFREDILARQLIASLPESSRILLGKMLLLALPVPLAAVQALDPGRTAKALQQMLDEAAALSLIDNTEEGGEPHYRVPHQFGGETPLVPVPGAEEKVRHAARVFDVLHPMWKTEASGHTEERLVELIRLAGEGEKKEELMGLADKLTTGWLNKDRYQETRKLLESILEKAGRPHSLLLNLAWAVGRLGEGNRAGELLEEAAAACPVEAAKERSDILFHYAGWLQGRGRPEEALRIYQSDLLPVLERLGDIRSRAVTMGQIADIYQARGQLDEALRIRREESLPVYEKLGDIRSRALTMGQIADIYQARGQLDEALRIRREEELPVYEKLGDIRSRAVTMGKIADIYQARGQLDEALRIRREEELPVYEKLGDIRSRALTMGQIADIYQARGQLDEALRIRREESLPVYEKLGDIRSRAVTMGQIADIYQARGQLDEALRIRREESLPVYEKLGDIRSRAVTMGQIADIYQARGQLDEALRIRREESLPVYEKLGDIRERAVTMGKIADIYQARGQLDEALRIRREEELPVYEKLGDIRSRAVTMGQIADIYQARGQLDEALRIRREESLPVYEKLGDIRSRAVTMGKIADIYQARGQLDEALRIRREESLPVYEKLGDIRERAVTMGKIADIYQARGQLDEALRIRREESLPVYEKLGDIRERAVTMGKIADIYQARGQLDEALRIRREEELPVYEKLGDIRSRALTMGQIADIYQARGQLDEALRIRREEELPVYEKLGDIRSRAVTMGKIADIYQARGQLDEALRIRREEELPVYEKLGDIRSRALTMGKIADIYQARGQLDEALRIRREEELPVYEKLGDIRERAVTMGQIADIYQARGQLDEALRIRREEELPVYAQLGARRDMLVCEANIAITLLFRKGAGDRMQAVMLLKKAHAEAAQMGLPEAQQIEQLLNRLNEQP